MYAYFKHEETPEGALYAVDLLRELTEERQRLRNSRNPFQPLS